MNKFWGFLKVIGVFLMLWFLGVVIFSVYIKDDEGIPR